MYSLISFFRVPLLPSQDDPDIECISADKKNPFKKDSTGFQLCYKALPHYRAFTQKRREKFRHKQAPRSKKHLHLLEEDNQPIPIKNEHELAHLYLDEVYSELSGCDISTLNLDAILNILSRASCFKEELRRQAFLVQREVRDKWLCSSMEIWTEVKSQEALDEIEKLSRLILSSSAASTKCWSSQSKTGVHSKIQKFRACIKNGQHEKIQPRIERLKQSKEEKARSVGGREIYVERRFKETNTEKLTSSVRDLLLPNKVVLLKGEAGAGKSSVVTKLVQRWAEGEEADRVAKTCRPCRPVGAIFSGRC